MRSVSIVFGREGGLGEQLKMSRNKSNPLPKSTCEDCGHIHNTRSLRNFENRFLCWNCYQKKRTIIRCPIYNQNYESQLKRSLELLHNKTRIVRGNGGRGGVVAIPKFFVGWKVTKIELEPVE